MTKRMPESPRLPELARSLRSLGASGDSCMDEAHEAVFVPLLEARTAAANASLDDAVDAMNGHALLSRIESAIGIVASRGIPVASRARALTAQAQDAIEPLRRALLVLDELAVVAGTDDGWKDWVDQLRRVFTAADDSCRSVAGVLAERDAKDAPARWYVRNTG